MGNLTSTIVLYNTERIKYPWREAINSVLPISERIVIKACHDTAAEWEALNDYIASKKQSDKIVVLNGKWGDKAQVIADLTNECLDAVETDWYLNIQADECLHENSYKEIEWLTTIQRNFTAARVSYHHLIGDFDTEFPFVYSRVARIALKDAGWFSYQDGMELVGGQGDIWNSKIQYFHTGKVDLGRSKEALEKEMAFWPMFVYLNPNFPDPKVLKAAEVGHISYNEIFDSSKPLFKPRTMPLPAALMPYVERLKANV